MINFCRHPASFKILNSKVIWTFTHVYPHANLQLMLDTGSFKNNHINKDIIIYMYRATCGDIYNKYFS